MDKHLGASLVQLVLATASPFRPRGGRGERLRNGSLSQQSRRHECAVEWDLQSTVARGVDSVLEDASQSDEWVDRIAVSLRPLASASRRSSLGGMNHGLRSGRERQAGRAPRYGSRDRIRVSQKSLRMDKVRNTPPNLPKYLFRELFWLLRQSLQLRDSMTI